MYIYGMLTCGSSVTSQLGEVLRQTVHSTSTSSTLENSRENFKSTPSMNCLRAELGCSEQDCGGTIGREEGRHKVYFS